jgi:hypothetical protein
MKQILKDKLLKFAESLDNKGLPDEANEIRELVSSEEKDATTSTTEGGEPESGEGDGEGGGNGGNNPTKKPPFTP